MSVKVSGGRLKPAADTHIFHSDSDSCDPRCESRSDLDHLQAEVPDLDHRRACRLPSAASQSRKCSAYATGWISATLPSGSHNGGEQADQRGAGTALAGAGWVLDLCSGHRYYRTITVRIVYRLCVVMG